MPKRIKENVQAVQVIKKSRFIAKLYIIDDEAQAKAIIKSLRKEYWDASHVCSALICGDIYRSNDDGEPSGSAGSPMLKTLQGAQLDHVLACVIRYFGGTELGVGGLIQAYCTTVSLALEEAVLLSPQDVYFYTITFPYEYINAIETRLSGCSVIQRDYDQLVRYRFSTTDALIMEELRELTHGQTSLLHQDHQIDYIEQES